MPGKFVIKKSAGQYYFVLKAGNGEIIATSERYTTKAAAKNGIESVKTSAPKAGTDDETGEADARSGRALSLGSIPVPSPGLFCKARPSRENWARD